MASISRIHVNYLVEPVGINGAVELGWVIESGLRDAVQESYRVRISRDGVVVHDTGVVEGLQSAGVRVELPWESLVRYEVLVDVVVSGMHASAGGCASAGERVAEAASGRTSFVTALQNPDEWHAGFVTAEREQDAGTSAGTLVRGTFQVRGLVREAWLVCTAHGLYLPFINGERVSADEMAPGWTSYNKRLRYQTYDVAPLLREGANVLGAVLGAGWYKGMMGYKHTRNNYGTRTAFAAQLLVRYEDGSEQVVTTDESWRGSAGPVLFSEIYGGEVYDARLEQPGWCGPGFDDSAWAPVELAERGASTLEAQQGCPVRAHERFAAQRLIVTPEGDRVLDFGQNLAGRCELVIEGAESGEVAELEFFEVLDAVGNVYTENLRGIRQVVRYVCRGGGREVYTPKFTFQGFQYARVNAWPGELDPAAVTAVALYSDMEQTGSFRCSDERVNQLWHNIGWGMRGNFLSLPTDCPQRDERLGWTGDVQAFGPTSCYLMNADAFYRNWLADVAADQDASGAVTNVVPDILTGNMEGDWLLDQDVQGGASGWGDVAVLLPWTLYQAYGDPEVLRRQMPSMQAWIAFMDEHAEGCHFGYGAQFGDWLGLDAEPGSYKGATPDEYCCAAFYCHSTELVGCSLAVLERSDEAERYLAHAQELREDFRRCFVGERGELMPQTQTAAVLALAFGLVEGELRERVAIRLRELVRESGGHLTTGFLGTPYLMQVLGDNGGLAEAYELLLREDFPSWLYQVAMGATTVWEHWDGKRPDGSMWSADMNSFNHYSYGSVGSWLMGSVAGIRPCDEAPGYERAVIRPQVGGTLTWAEGSYRSVRGKLACRWEREDGEVALRVRVPANVRARIELAQAACVLDGDGLSFVPAERGWVAECGSGEYRVLWRMAVEG